MSPKLLKSKLSGVFGFPVTPMNDDLSIDLIGLRENVRRYLNTGVSAIFAAAGTGEFFNLTLDEYSQIVTAAVEEVNGALPVIAGCGYGMFTAEQYASAARNAGADGLLVLPPYLIQSEQSGLVQHYQRIADSADIGIILYHRDNAIFTPQSVSQLCNSCANVIGFKDGSGNLEVFKRITLAVGDRLAFMNGMPTAEMTAPGYFAVGCTSYSSAISNFIPHVTMRFYQSLLNGNNKDVDEILSHVIVPLCRIRDMGKGYAVSYVKAAMKILGLPSGPVRPPLTVLRAEEVKDLEHTLKLIQERYPA